jgi:hypothetical protein
LPIKSNQKNFYEYIKKTLRIPKDREIKIKLPKSFKVDKKGIVSIGEDLSAEYKKKWN